MQSLEAPAAAGQIWLVEHEIGRPLAGGDRAALTGANVVLYQRELAPLVASLLPVGSYAEPTEEAGLSPRAVTFAGEGWSVAQRLQSGDGLEARLQRLSEALAALGRLGDLPISVTVKPAVGRPRELDASVRTAASILADVAREGMLTLVFGPLPLRFAAAGRAHAFTANGLAG